MSLATCEEALVRLAAARVHWQEAADWAEATHDPLSRAPFARRRFEALDPRVPRLTLRLAAGAPQDSSVKRDGVDLKTIAFDVALPVDPGEHTVVVTAAGRSEAKLEVTLGEGEQKILEVAPGPPFAAAGAPPINGTARAASETRGAGAADASSSSAGKGQNTLAMVAGGVGVLSLGTGVVTGLVASSKWSAARSDCKPGACDAGSRAQGERSDAVTTAAISTISFAAGGALLAAGIALWLTSPSHAAHHHAASMRVVPTVGTNGGGVACFGGF